MKTYYQTDNEGYFLYEFEAPEGPLPHNSTELAPTFSEGFVARFTGVSWEQVENHKGEQGYVYGEPFEIYEYGPYPEGWSATPPPPSEDELAQQEYSAAVSESTNLLLLRMQRELVQVDDFTEQEFSVFAKAGLFPVWEPNAHYEKNERIVFENIVYEVQQELTSQAHQKPGDVGMLSSYRPISSYYETESDGSLDKPYAYLHGMDVYSGKYYTFENALYLAKADLLPCVWDPGTPGLWQWELITN